MARRNLTYFSGEEDQGRSQLWGTRDRRLRAASATQPMTTYLIWACPEATPAPSRGGEGRRRMRPRRRPWGRGCEPQR
jgi:hypothetical protein